MTDDEARDQFALKAMPIVAADYPLSAEGFQKIASVCYLFANAMMDARAREMAYTKEHADDPAE